MKELFKIKFKPNKSTLVAALLGILAIISSLMLKFNNSVAIKFVFRDLIQMAIIGILIPMTILAKNGEFQKAGMRFDKAYKYIFISIVLGGITSIKFIKFAAENGLYFKADMIQPAIYVMTANVFEVIFFFIFLRYYFEKAFGIIPAIILTAAFYSLHHAGFEPTYFRLFIVGIVFISIFRIANNWLICFPMWWVGGLGDVLFISAEITRYTERNLIRALPALCILIFMFVYKYPFKGLGEKIKENI